MPIDDRADRVGAPPAAAVHRQNAAGDIVIPLARGEIVALPRLWSCDLTVTGPDRGVLVGTGGLRATVTFTESTAVIESVAEEPLLRTADAR
jgi:hypothetical protein